MDDDAVGIFYRDFYSATFESGAFSGFAYSLTHKLLENSYQKSESSIDHPTILEVGAGKGEHLKFVKNDFSEYVNLDLFEAPDSFSSEYDDRVTWMQADILDVRGIRKRFDRVIVMCVLHHVNSPEKAISNMLQILKPGGVLSIFLPSDPGLLNRLNRKFFITPRVRKLGFSDYELVNAREHHNHFWALKKELLHQTKGFNRKIRYYPFSIPLASMSLFSIWTLTKPSEK